MTLSPKIADIAAASGRSPSPADRARFPPTSSRASLNADGSALREKARVCRTIESVTDDVGWPAQEVSRECGGGAKAAVTGYRSPGKTGITQKIGMAPTARATWRPLHRLVLRLRAGRGSRTVPCRHDRRPRHGQLLRRPDCRRASCIFHAAFPLFISEPSINSFAGMGGRSPAKTQKQFPHRARRQGCQPDLPVRCARPLAASDRGLNCDPDGSGYAVSQSIPANTLVDKGTTVTVQFQSQ